MSGQHTLSAAELLANDGLEAAQEALIALEGAPDSITVRLARQKLKAFIAKAQQGGSK